MKGRKLENGVGWKEQHQKLDQAEMVRMMYRSYIGPLHYKIPGGSIHWENGTPRSWAVDSLHSYVWGTQSEMTIWERGIFYIK